MHNSFINHTLLKSFFNFLQANSNPELPNPCQAPIISKLFKCAKPAPWTILDKEVVDEIIFRTVKPRNRLLLELMARGGMAYRILNPIRGEARKAA